MSKKTLIFVATLSGIWLAPLHAQDFNKVAFNIGGGVSTPLNPTAQYVGINGNFNVGAGYNIDKKNSITGEFMWSGLPGNRFVLHPVNAPFGDVNLYALTAEYRHHIDRIGRSPFGVYVVGGGGWYYRYAKVDRNFFVPPQTVCDPIYSWWGYGCDSGGYVITETIAFKGSSAGGVNAGAGFTIRLSDNGWKFYIESKYHYAWNNRIPTTLVPVTFGFRFN